MNHVEHVEILGLGHPRTGTAYTSKVLSDWGLDVGHEELGKQGIVSWLLVKPKGPYLSWHQRDTGIDRRPTYDHLVYNTRDPKTALASIVYTETPPCDKDGTSWCGTKYYQNYNHSMFDYDSTYFRKTFIGLNSDNPVENAIDSICQFHEMILRCRPDVQYRIENEEQKLFNYFKSVYSDIQYIEHPEKVNVRKHNSFERMANVFPTPSKQHIERINHYAMACGYDKVEF